MVFVDFLSLRSRQNGGCACSGDRPLRRCPRWGFLKISWVGVRSTVCAAALSDDVLHFQVGGVVRYSGGQPMLSPYAAKPLSVRATVASAATTVAPPPATGVVPAPAVPQFPVCFAEFVATGVFLTLEGTLLQARAFFFQPGPA